MKLPRTILAFFLVTVAALQAASPVVGKIGITVSDMERSLEFYTKALTFQKVSDREFFDPAFDKLTGEFGARVRVVGLKLGDETLELTEYRNISGKPIPADSRSNDGWFQHAAIVVNDMEAAFRHLQKFNVKPTSPAPQRLPAWNPNAGGIQAFYFRDPDNHNLEIIWFPAGKGDPKWQGKKAGPFLGIDHTAIVVADTDKSVAFYRDKLGFRVAGESNNYGIEQEYLNHVRGARLRITGLRGTGGPGIELLEYQKPGPGRAYPADAKPSDLVHWQTEIRYPEIDTLVSNLIREQTALISAGIVQLTGGAKACLLRDNSGHALLVSEIGAIR